MRETRIFTTEGSALKGIFKYHGPLMQYLTVFRVGNEYGIILIKAAREEPLSVRFCVGIGWGKYRAEK